MNGNDDDDDASIGSVHSYFSELVAVVSQLK